MPSAGFKPATPATKRSQTYALERSASGIGPVFILYALNTNMWLSDSFKFILRTTALYLVKIVIKQILLIISGTKYNLLYAH
jgi:hypothetical protein